jgi:UDP-N-acetylglucosamine acyltransferase
MRGADQRHADGEIDFGATIIRASEQSFPVSSKVLRVSVRTHSWSIVEDGARLGEGVAVGPFCHIGAGVELGASVELASHVVVAGDTYIGPGTKIFPFASIGTIAQDLKSRDDIGRLRIGSNCVIREGVTINLGTRLGVQETSIGDHCALLANSHVAHDCRIGDHVVLSNGVLLGGHVRIGDHVGVGGGTAVHQHVRIGAHAFVAGMSGLEGDVVPFGLAGGNRAHLFGLNLVGLRRRNFSNERVSQLRDAYKILFAQDDMSESVLSERIEAVARAFGDDEDIATLLDFLREESSRPLCAPRPRARS